MTGDDSRTPVWLLKAIRTEFGDLYDPCPVDPDFDGLDKWWGKGVAYVNPPYSNIKPWVYRAMEQPIVVVMLLPVRPGSEWWVRWHHLAEIRFFRHRIHFVGQGRPMFDSCLWILRPVRGEY